MLRRATLLATILGCSNAPASATTDASTAAPRDAVTDVPAGRDVTAPDAHIDDVVASDAPGARCVLNRDCPDDQRCACADGDCRCARGPRGTGRAGEATCASGDDCASSLCVDGTAGMICSDACESAADCPASLPRCVSVGALGISLCARDPNARPDAGGSATSLDATFGARRGVFDRAQHGRDGATGIRVEAHFGGDPACPNERSPTPRRTLLVLGIRADVSAVQTEAGGVRATLLDFSGDLVSAPTLRATAVRVTPMSLGAGTRVRFELRATFPGGEVTGTVDAPWCASLDG